MNPMIGVSWMNLKQAGYSISHIRPESFFNPASSCHRTLQQCFYGTSHSIEKAMCRCRTVPNAALITLHELAYPSCLSSAHFVIQGRFLIHFIWTLPPSLLHTEAVIFRPERQKKRQHTFLINSTLKRISYLYSISRQIFWLRSLVHLTHVEVQGLQYGMKPNSGNTECLYHILLNP